MEEVKEELIEEIKEETPVYVLEDSIPDILALNELQEEIDKTTKEKEAKEEEVDKAVENKRNKSEEIGIINTGDQIEKVTYNLKILSELNAELDKLKVELEDIYGELRNLEEDKTALEATAKKMVEEFTKAYDELVKKQVKAVDSYLFESKQSDLEEANKLADEIKKYKKYASFEDILKQNEIKTEKIEETKEIKEEAKQEEIKEPIVEEQKVEAPIEEKTEEVKVEEAPIELSEVKVDEIESKEEVNEVPTIETPVNESIPSFDNITIVEPKVEIKPLLTSKLDKIADSNNKGITSTINVFNSKKTEQEDKKLALVA